MQAEIGLQIEEVMRAYSTECEQAIDKAAAKAARDTKSELQSSSPSKTGDYAKGWAVKRSGAHGRVVYNSTDYQLTHLLEYGHVTKNQFGVFGRTPAHPHIADAEKKGNEEFEQEVRAILEK